MYFKMETCKRRYKNSVVSRAHRYTPLTLEEMWLLSGLPGILGFSTFGEIEAFDQDMFVWKIEDANWVLRNTPYVSEKNAAEDLAVIQAGLFPDWYDASKRQRRVLQLKTKIEEEFRSEVAQAAELLCLIRRQNELSM